MEQRNASQSINQNSPVISVIIPTYNRVKTLCACVDSVLASIDPPPFELVIVDDCSPDNTSAEIERRFCRDRRVTWIRNKTNLNQAGARNIGAAHARGDRLLFLDDDNIVSPTMLKELSAAMDRDPGLGLAAPLSLQHYDRDAIWTLGSGYNFWTSRPVNVAEGIPPADFTGDLIQTRPTCYSPNAFMVSRDAWNRIGGFDALYRVMYEEADFGYRILRAGFEGAIVPRAITRHCGAICRGDAQRLRHLGIETPKRAYLFARNRSIFLKRFAPWFCLPTALLVFTPLSAVYYCTVALRHHAPAVAAAYLRGTLIGLFGVFRPQIPPPAIPDVPPEQPMR